LGLRVVKKTVNFDNHHVYHFYYGDERGTPGTIWTTFPYHGRGVRVGTKGAGQITVTSFSVPKHALEFWAARCDDRGLAVMHPPSRFGESFIVVEDPSGLAIELVATDQDTREPWRDGGIPADMAIRGLHSVTLTIRASEQTLALMTGLLGYRIIDRAGDWIRVGVNGGGPGRQMDLLVAPDAPAAVNGLGTVHHVAMAIPDDNAQLRLRRELLALDYKVTPVMDRQYFRSIYFREPGGVLFEVATMHPGFLFDEALDSLGRALKLPQAEEARREDIEAGLAPVTYRA
ncbi:MAG: VOC family protein, partial [Planctomycetota bacterium]|nr:VOC family protein [Planctomycetota bacterium]